MEFDANVIDAYHGWFYTNDLWKRTYLGVPIAKLPLDLWNYQEVIFERRPVLVLEFGTFAGGSALFFADVLSRVVPEATVLTIDVEPRPLDQRVANDPRIERMTCSSVASAVSVRVAEIRAGRPGPIFAIVDSDHSMEHVLAEMISLRSILRTGDYLVVEDGNVNAHPVVPAHGPGPLEAVREYVRRYPNDYRRDVARESLFGFTFAPEGFLIRR